MWILKPIKNAPYPVKVQFISQISNVYHKATDNARSVIQSVSALKNFITIAHSHRMIPNMAALDEGITEDYRNSFRSYH